MPLILARDSDRGLGELELRDLDEDAAAGICERIAATDALDRARELARSRVADAKLALREASGISDEDRRLLELVADGVVERYS
jgi:geranylgeranyl pyrophosphate synthase